MSWIVEGVIGRRAQFSTVIVYQTNDPKRFEQFLNYCASEAKNRRINKVYVFFVWRGLFEVVFGERISFRPVSQQVSANVPLPMPATGSAIKSLEMALDFIDTQFRAGENIWFVIHGVFQRNDVLTSALRSWTFDTDIYEKGHTIVVFTENPATLFDEETLKYFNYVKVPTSTEQERKEVLERLVNVLGLKTKINGLVHATAGLNLHEVESVALKSFYKFRDLKHEVLAEYKNDIIRKSGILDIEEPEHGFEAVGGYEVLKNFIRDNVIKILQNPKKAEKLGLRPPRGLLLFGMGGTGKSVTGDTRIIISFDKRKWFYIPIKELEKFVAFNRKEGDTEIADLEGVAKIYTLALNPETFKLEITEIKQFIRHRAKKGELVKVVTETGRIVKATKDHSFLVLQGLDLVPMKPENIVGKYVPLAKWLPSSEGAKCPKADIYGLYVAEGTTRFVTRGTPTRYCVMITTTDDGLKQIAKSWGFREYELKNKAPTYVLSGFDVAYEFMTKCGRTAENKKVPEDILNADIDSKRTFLRAYFSGDGTALYHRVGINKTNKTIEAVTKSFQLSEDLMTLLLSLGIVARRRVKTTKSGGKYYVVAIHRSDMIRKFIDEIGFVQEYKNKITEALPANYTNAEYIPFDEMMYSIARKYVSYTRKNLRERFFAQTLREVINKGKKRVLKQTIVRLVEKFGAKEFEKFAYGDVEWDKVVKVEEIDTDDGYVYDLSTKHENFVLANGIVVHNTHFARALAKELKLPFLRLRTENIVSKYYGETERSMARALELAEEIAPCVLFIDEIDRFGQRGQLGEHEATRRTFSILLEWLGDARRKTIVIGTTNRPEDLDEAFIRVGRFDYIIPMLLPDLEARKQILHVHTKVIRKVPLAKNVDLNEIAEKTEWFTGAEIEELVLRSARNALKNDRDKVTAEDFETALATFRINYDARKEQMERYLQLAERFCNDAEFLQNLVREQGLVDRVEILKKELQI